MRKKLSWLLLLSLSGCASSVIETNDIVKKTSISLRVAPELIRISNRKDSGVRTDYTATILSGGRYSCYLYIEGSFPKISDAICSSF